MPTILELITLTTDYFEKKGISSARINAELLLADILKCKRLNLYLSFDKPVGESEVNQYREYVRRRAKFEPLQYIIGNVEFFGIEFIVNKDVLIPRQETEILIEEVIKEINISGYATILDVGTGSGIIPICVSHRNETVFFDAIDISHQALEVAKQNAVKNKLTERINFFQQNIFDGFSIKEKKYDLIVSNPPYVPISEYNSLQKEIVEYEPGLAVTDFGDGLTFYKAITNFAINSLNDNGMVIYEVGKDQSLSVAEIMRVAGFNQIEIVKDYLNIDRVIKGKKL